MKDFPDFEDHRRSHRLSATSYRRLVLHCRILDHEDNGTMQNARIGIPDSSGGIASAHNR